MFGLYRAARTVAAFMTLAFAFAAPSIAADAEPAQMVSLMSVPPVSASTFQPQSSATSVPLVQPQASAPVAPVPAVAVTPELQPSVDAPQKARSLRDLVISFVDYGDRDAEEECLVKAIYFEARSESLEGQLAVAEVILNRAASGRYPPTICEVVTQPAQFSFIRAGRFPEADTSSTAWRTALAIADIALKRLSPQVAPNVLWYHATYVSPSWGRRLTRFAQIGTHIFYS
jgi:hypothetical protein